MVRLVEIVPKPLNGKRKITLRESCQQLSKSRDPRRIDMPRCPEKKLIAIDTNTAYVNETDAFFKT